ncbi:MAG: DUF72 domain-containing protein [Deltaproteobacteria bacterium]|nr:DUF72 domain-containing protein [Deltaproteobacteria bacterium]
MEKKGRVHIATSGWYYEHWRGPFYPERLPKSEFLKFYSETFETVEINNTFYRLPEIKTLEMWRDMAPERFIFSVKASRLITHNKKLKDPDKTNPTFIERLTAHGKKLVPILFQLPPKWKRNPERLEEFLASLTPDCRYAFEFRDPSWFDQTVYSLLSRFKAAFCIYDFDFLLSPKEVTADFVYIRLHGPAGKYRGSYSDEALSGWARLFKQWTQGEGKEIFCYFDNDEKGYAARDALRLRELVK